MDRKSLREYTHKADSFLTLDNNTYKQWVFRYTFLELEKDLSVNGDITTDTIFPGPKAAKAHLVAKSDGVFAGESEARYFLLDADPNFRPGIKGNFSLKFNIKDGEKFKKGDVLLEIEADVHDLLAAERVLVNLLMRMSSVATFARRVVDTLADFDVLVTPTRKTLWGLIDKKAVVIGGGGTHRLSLGDAILVKDNHIDLVNRDFDLLISNIVSRSCESRFVEVEVRNLEDTINCANAFVSVGSSLDSVPILLMDNMSPAEISEAISILKTKGFYDSLLLEASGGIKEEDIVDFAKTGVDIISMGALTYEVKSVDMSLKIVS